MTEINYTQIAARNAIRQKLLASSVREEAEFDHTKYDSNIYVICPTCRGHKYLFTYNQKFPNEPPTRTYCCSCMESGVIAVDNRSLTTSI